MTGPRTAPDAQGFTPVDLQLADLVGRLARDRGEDGELLQLSAALVSRERSRGHACLPLATVAGHTTPWRGQGFIAPDLADWRKVLQASDLVAPARSDAEARPLVLDAEDRLYLWRYWRAERRVASRLRNLAESEPPQGDRATASRLWRRLFPDAVSKPEVDWQAAAVAAALVSPLTLISGGPGTGKTTTVARLLAVLSAAWPGLRISLAAPTGKAAARLGEAIGGQLERIAAEIEDLPPLTTQAATLHRTLGYRPRQDRFLHHPRRPLTCDLLVIDEASMVDLLMMDAVLGALPAGGRLVLLGDRDQLASVDTGFVFGDLCRAAGLVAQENPTLPARLAGTYSELAGRDLGSRPQTGAAEAPLEGRGVELMISYRFQDQPGIGALATALRAGRGGAALAVLDQAAHPEVMRHEPPSPQRRALEPLRPALTAYFAGNSPATALERLATFRVLTATRRGRWGAERLNLLMEAELDALGHLDGTAFYRGRPLLIEANDYQVKLFNGDLGICWPEDGQTWAFFPDSANPASPGGLRRIALAKLPAHSTAWAMTVHKSQGSEMDHVLLVLGDEDRAGILSRELVYTGVTRARRRVDVVAPAALLSAAVARSGRRVTGLADALER